MSKNIIMEGSVNLSLQSANQGPQSVDRRLGLGGYFPSKLAYALWFLAF